MMNQPSEDPLAPLGPDMLRCLAQVCTDTATTTGPRFYKALARSVAERFGFDRVIIAIPHGRDEVETLALYTGAGHAQNQRFQRAGTPFADLFNGQRCFYPQHIASAFPDDPFVQADGLQGYLGFPLRDEQGQVQGALAVAQCTALRTDEAIAEVLERAAMRAGPELARDQAEMALQRREARYRALLEQVQDVVFQTDDAGRWTVLNPAWHELTGFTVESSLGSSVLESVDPRDRAHGQTVLEALLRHERDPCRDTLRCRRDDGGVLEMTLQARPLIDDTGQVIGTSGTLSPGSRRAESDASRPSDEDSLHWGSIDPQNAVKLLLDPESGRIEQANRAACVFYGLRGEELTGCRMGELHRLDEARTQRFLDAARAGNPHTFRSQHRDAAGASHEVRVDTTPVTIAGQTRLDCTVIDLEPQQRAGWAQELFGTAPEQISYPIVITDPQGRIQYANPAFEHMTGFDRTTALGHTMAFMKSGEHDAGFYAALWDTLQKGESWHGRFRNRRQDGTLFTAETVITPVWDASGQIRQYLACQRDITEALETEQQIRHVQRLEALGQLTASVAHDFKNLLQVINLGTEAALAETAPDHPLHADLSEILHAGERASQLVGQLLKFGHDRAEHGEPLDLNAIIRETEAMLCSAIGSGIAWRWALSDEPVRIHANRVHVEQILLNLCVNARDAMPRGGKLTVSTETIRGEASAEPGQHEPPPGEWIRLTVADTGCGMDPATQARVFEPFFSTKAPDHGTGIGLATVYRIVEQDGGYIELDSEPGIGTRFAIHWPSLDRAPERGTPGVLHPAGDTDTIRECLPRIRLDPWDS